MVAYAPTEEIPEGQKAKNMAALHSTVASVPAREYVFVLTDANAGQGREVTAEGKQTARRWVHMVETCSTKMASYSWISQKTTSSFQSANRSKGQARLGYILTKQADHRLIHCVDDGRPPLEDQNRITTSCAQKIASHASPHQTRGRGTVPRKLRRQSTLGD